MKIHRWAWLIGGMANTTSRRDDGESHHGDGESPPKVVVDFGCGQHGDHPTTAKAIWREM